MGTSEAATTPDPAASIVYYLHIHKAGGTSLRELAYWNHDDPELADELIPGRVEADGRPRVIDSEAPEVRAFLRTIRDRQHELKVVAANLPFGIHRYLDVPVAYCTFLREPVERGRSFWRFAYSNRAIGRLWREWERLKFDVEAILEHPSGTGLLNEQTRMISGSGERLLGPEHLATAQAHLRDRFFFIGDFADYEGDVEALSSLLGWEHRRPPRLNVTRAESLESIPDGFDEVISAANQIDRELYTWTRELGPHRVAAR